MADAYRIGRRRRCVAGTITHAKRIEAPSDLLRLDPVRGTWTAGIQSERLRQRPDQTKTGDGRWNTTSPCFIAGRRWGRRTHQPEAPSSFLGLGFARRRRPDCLRTGGRQGSSPRSLSGTDRVAGARRLAPPCEDVDRGTVVTSPRIGRACVAATDRYASVAERPLIQTVSVSRLRVVDALTEPQREAKLPLWRAALRANLANYQVSDTAPVRGLPPPRRRGGEAFCPLVRRATRRMTFMVCSPAHTGTPSRLWISAARPRCSTRSSRSGQNPLLLLSLRG